MSTCVDVVVPGLAGPSSAGAPDETARALLAGLELKGVTRLFRRGRIEAREAPHAGLDAIAVDRLGVDIRGGLCAGELSRAGAQGTLPPDGAWLRADPVHLRADLAKLIVFPPQVLSLSLHHAQSLSEWLAAQMGETALDLHLLTPQAWLCRIDAPARLETVSPVQAYGRNAAEVLPRGDDAAHWHALMNEVQMLLHECPVNEERESDGLPPVNSLWFWGAGPVPGPVPGGGYATVCSDDPAVLGCASLAGVDAVPLPAQATRWCEFLSPGHHLLTLDGLEVAALGSDPDAWRAALQTLETDWLLPLSHALDAGDIHTLRLILDRAVLHAHPPRWLDRLRRPPAPDAVLAQVRAVTFA